ncbi:MAG: tetratricopeptide repeat protein [Proteobacteria bacterium]|nr:tetratricopeptide repeat protein [Pseudomonadota bacterium]
MPRLLLLLALALLAIPPGAARAEADPMDLFVDGVEAMEAGELARAVDFFDQAARMRPDNPEFVYYKGLALEKMGKNGEALVLFRDLLEKRPQEYRKAYFDIAAVQVKQKQHQEAMATLQEAVASDPGDARARMEAGVVAREMGRFDLAIQYFEKAAQLNPETAPTAQHMIAVTHLDMEDFDLSENLFRQVMQTYPNDPVAAASAQSLAILGKIKKARKPWYVRAQFTMGWDDNVSNQPLDPPPAVRYPEKEDFFQNLYLAGGYRLINEKERRVGAGLALHHLGYRDLSNNNILSWNPHFFGEWDFTRLHLRLQYDYGYYYTGGSDGLAQDDGMYLTFASPFDKLRTHQVTSSLVLDEAHGMKTQLGLAWLQKDYFDLTPDADGFTVNVVQLKAFGNSGRTARLGYTFYYENAEEERYTYFFNEGTAGFSTPVAWGVIADASYSLVLTQYEENPALWKGDRKDTTHRFTGLVTREITDWLQVSLTYILNHNDSNVTRAGVDEYKYRRNLILAALSLSF